jgi:hypothetical protein
MTSLFLWTVILQIDFKPLLNHLIKNKRCSCLPCFLRSYKIFTPLFKSLLKNLTLAWSSWITCSTPLFVMFECLLSFDCLVCLTLCELLCVSMIYKWAFGPTYFKCIKIYCGQWGYSYQSFSAHSIIKLFYCFLLYNPKFIFLMEGFFFSKYKFIKNPKWGLL